MSNELISEVREFAECMKFGGSLNGNDKRIKLLSDTADALESQAREIDSLNAEVERKMAAADFVIKELRAALVEAVDALDAVIQAHGYEGGTPVEALTHCKEALG